MNIWRASSEVFRLIDRGASSAVDAARFQYAHRGIRAARAGVVGPGDPPPPPNAPDHFDYRGVVLPSGAKALDGPYRVGNVFDPRRGPASGSARRAGLPAYMLRRHAAIVGPTGSGKTKSILAPWICEAVHDGNSVVAIDVSGDLLAEVEEYRRSGNLMPFPVAMWDYTAPERSMTWNPLASLDSPEAIDSITDALLGRENPFDPQPFFAQRDRRILRNILTLIAGASRNRPVQLLVRSVQDQAVLQRLASLVPAIGSRLDEVLGLGRSDYGRAMSGISNAVDVFNHPGVAAITTGDSEQFTVADIFSTPRLLVIGAPLHGGSMAGTVSSLLAGQIVRHLYTRYTSAEGTDAFLCFDEAPRLSKNIDLEQLLTTTRRTRTSVVLGVQNVSQLEDRTRSTILNNCSTYLSLPTPDQASAEFFASRLGHRQQSTFTSNQSYGGEGGHRQITRQLSTVNVIGLREIMHPPWGDRIAMAHITQLGPSPLLLDLTRRDLVS